MKMHCGTVISYACFAIFIVQLPQIWAQCNTCSATTQMACVSQNQYQACVNGVPAGSVNTCPNGNICSTATSITCQSNVSGIVPTCGSCNVCNANLTFACTGVNTYALCLNTSTPSALTGSCGGSLVCNANISQICGDPLAGITATCPSSTIQPTSWTPSLTTPTTLPTYAQYLCQNIRINARFSIPVEYDTSCKRYIYCFLTTNSTWSGQIYTCAGSTYFDPYSRYCVATRPNGCKY